MIKREFTRLDLKNNVNNNVTITFQCILTRVQSHTWFTIFACSVFEELRNNGRCSATALTAFYRFFLSVVAAAVVISMRGENNTMRLFDRLAEAMHNCHANEHTIVQCNRMNDDVEEAKQVAGGFSFFFSAYSNNAVLYNIVNTVRFHYYRVSGHVCLFNEEMVLFSLLNELNTINSIQLNWIR